MSLLCYVTIFIDQLAAVTRDQIRPPLNRGDSKHNSHSFPDKTNKDDDDKDLDQIIEKRLLSAQETIIVFAVY